jgi:hypothetical protein
MASSTSSSKRILGFAFIAFVLWQALTLARIFPPSPGISQGQINAIRGENYIYSELPIPRLVLIGSSTVARIKASYVGSHVTNLALDGGCAQTGLEILLRSHRTPPIVLVELDETLARKTDPFVIDALFGWGSEPIHRALPGTRQSYQPGAIAVMLFNQLIEHIHYLRKGSKQEITASKAPPDPTAAAQDLKNQMITLKVEQKSHLMRGKVLADFESEVLHIREQVDQLRSQGSRVIFFRVPGEKAVFDTPLERQDQELFHRLLPTHVYEWLPSPRSVGWQTSDGIHLNDSEAMRYGAYLRTTLISENPPKLK